MTNELLKLDIQFFADAAGNGTTMDTVKTEEIGKNIVALGKEIIASLNIIGQTAGDLYNNAGLDSQAGESLNSAMNDIKGYFEKYESSISNLGDFLVNVAQAFLTSDIQMSKELSEWGATVKNVVNNFNEGINSQAAQGSYDATAYVKDLIGSGVKISGATRIIANEAATMFGNTGTFIKSTTGKNMLEIGADVTNKAVGTIGTLFGYAGDNGASTTINTIFNTIGTGVSGLAQFLNKI